jgi:hypothetical protein
MPVLQIFYMLRHAEVEMFEVGQFTAVRPIQLPPTFT